ncbi:MAG: COG4280 domain-containing protein [Candidatus Dormibacteria bacterium]
MHPDLLTFGTAFVGSAVEAVETLTIVLALGLSRGWRAPIIGTVVAAAILGTLVLLLGVQITRVPESLLRLVVGSLALLFGLRWLTKAVLRSAGVIALHDEQAEFQSTLREIEGAGQGIDRLAFFIAFKSTLLEGVEVAFIVIAVGGGAHSFPSAIAGGLAAIAAIVAIGAVVRHPLSAVPENTLKYAVGLMLTSMGTFWATEGMGAHWPFDLGSVLGLLACYWVASRLAITGARRMATA